MKTHSVEDVAQILGLNPVTVRNMLRDGRLTGFKIGSRWRLTDEDLNEFMARQRKEVKHP